MALKILTQPNTGKTFRMGRKRSVARGPRLSLRNYLIAGQEPTPPPGGTYATAAAVSLSNIYENDTLGDCVIAAMGHMTMQWSWYATGGKSVVTPTDAQILEAYKALCPAVSGPFIFRVALPSQGIT